MLKQKDLAVAVATFMLTGAGTVHATATIEVSFADPSAAYSSYYADLERIVLAAGNDWTSHFSLTQSSTLTVQIGFAAIATANGASATSSFVGSSGGINIFEQGAAAEIKSGIDPNGAAADILFNVGINGYLQNELWFDPNPISQLAPVPSTQTDARSVFLHEFGHAFGFNGWRDASDGTLPGDYESTFDSLSTFNAAAIGGPTITFNGASAVANYGGSVPLTFGNYGHVGNSAPRTGANLIGVDGDLMNGVAFYRGLRYKISDLDLAMMQDLGLPLAVAVPEPNGTLLVALGLAVLGLRRHRIQNFR